MELLHVSPFSCVGSARNELILEIVRRIIGFLSIIGSSFIVSDIVKKVHDGNGTDPYQRIMLVLSMFDIIYSIFVPFGGTWMVPKGTGWRWAVGNTASCSAQGFFYMFGAFGEIFYQAAISLNILLLIVFGWTQEKFAKKVEKPMHVIIITVVLIIAIVPLAFQSYNPFCGQCIPTLVWKCSIKDEKESCNWVLRGARTVAVVSDILSGSLLIIALIFCTVAMVWVYLHVRRQEVKMQRYVFRGSASEKHKESKRIRKILFLYTLSLYLTFGIFLIYVFVFVFGRNSFSVWISLPRSVLPSLLGFYNMLVYFLPNCLKYQRDHPGTWLVTAYLQVLRSSAPCALSLSGICCGQKEDVEDAPEMNFAKYNTTNEQTAPISDDTEA